MTITRMQSRLETKGFRCQTTGATDIKCVRKFHSNADELYDAVVHIVTNRHLDKRKRWIAFNCEAYNGCTYTKEKIKQEITERYRMEPKLDMSNPEGNWVWTGSDGDRITLVDTGEFDTKPHRIIFSEGTYGQPLDF